MAKQLPPLDRLDELFSYDPETGRLSWRADRGTNLVAGCEAGWIGKNGYRYVLVDNEKWLAHRVAWKIHNRAEPPNLVDHRNRKPTDNTPHNMRAASPTQNVQNRRMSTRNTTGHRGASPRNGLFRATIKAGGKQIHLGDYPTAEEAGAAYARAACVLFGEFAADSPSTGETISAEELRAQIQIGSRVYTNNSSGRRGVSFAKGRNAWVAYGDRRGKRTSIGQYRTYEEACAARERFEAETAILSRATPER